MKPFQARFAFQHLEGVCLVAKAVVRVAGATLFFDLCQVRIGHLLSIFFRKVRKVQFIELLVNLIRSEMQNRSYQRKVNKFPGLFSTLVLRCQIERPASNGHVH